MTLTEKEFNQVYFENRLKLLKYTYGLIKDHHYCEEIVQEAFARFFKYADIKDLKEPTPWLFVVCRNLGLKLLKKNKKIVVDHVDRYGAGSEEYKANRAYECRNFSLRSDDTSFGMQTFESSPLEGLCEQEDSEDLVTKITKAMATLKPHHQKILKLRYFENMSYGGIAKAMKISEGNTGFLLHDAKRRLKKIYREQNYVGKSEDRHDCQRGAISRTTNSVQPSSKRGLGSSKVRRKGVCRRRSESCIA